MKINYLWLKENDSRIYNITVDEHFLLVTVTADATAVRRWFQETLNNEINQTCLASHTLVVGIGVQWVTRPDDDDGEEWSAAETLQLCIASSCLIFQIGRAEDVPIELRDFLMNPSCTFVGFWTNDDRWLLYYSQHGLNMQMDPMDMRLNLNDEPSRGSVGRIIRNVLGFRGVGFREEIYTGNWSVATLSNEQVLFASSEAYCAFVMGINLRIWEYRAQVSGSGNQEGGDPERVAL